MTMRGSGHIAGLGLMKRWEHNMEPYNEHELPDDYPIYGDYLYVADGKVYRSDYHEITVGELKRREKFTSFKNCDIGGRDLWNWAKP